MKNLFLALLLFCQPAMAVTVETTYSHTLDAQGAGADHTSSSITTSNSSSGSYHCIWASLTGTIDGTFVVQVSNDGGTDWVAKSGASITLAGASGSDVISLNNVVTEQKYRIKYTHNSISGGTVNCYAEFKG